MPLSEIALDCGFADQAHLCREFSKSTGKSPAAWRKQNSNGDPVDLIELSSGKKSHEKFH